MTTPTEADRNARVEEIRANAGVKFTKQEWRELYNALMIFPTDEGFERVYKSLKDEDHERNRHD